MFGIISVNILMFAGIFVPAFIIIDDAERKGEIKLTNSKKFQLISLLFITMVGINFCL
jgi:hypothetical protein